MAEWIDVKDKLPKDVGRVLTLTNGGVIGMGYHDSDGIDTKWVIITNIFQADVTHWMPLPELPKVS